MCHLSILFNIPCDRYPMSKYVLYALNLQQGTKIIILISIQFPGPRTIATRTEDWVCDVSQGFRAFHCLHCPYESKKISHIKSHFNARHSLNPTTFDCPNCQYRAKDRKSIKIHFICRHLHNVEKNDQI